MNLAFMIGPGMLWKCAGTGIAPLIQVDISVTTGERLRVRSALYVVVAGTNDPDFSIVARVLRLTRIQLYDQKIIYCTVQDWGLDLDEVLFLRSISLKRDPMEECLNYPFNIPSISNLNTLKFESQVTFFVGENGSGKSTLLEAIALALGFNPEGGSKNYNFTTRDSHSSLYDCIKLNKSYLQPKDGFFLRAESFYNLATNIDDLDSVAMNSPLVANSFGGKSLHSQSHGESFLSLLINRLWGNGIYLLDEPEAALSPSRQMTALSRIHELVKLSSQFIIATHSPIIMAYPHATIYHLGEDGMERIPYEETEHYQITKYFMNNREKMLRELL